MTPLHGTATTTRVLLDSAAWHALPFSWISVELSTLQPFASSHSTRFPLTVTRLWHSLPGGSGTFSRNTHSAEKRIASVDEHMSGTVDAAEPAVPPEAFVSPAEASRSLGTLEASAALPP